MKVLRGIVYMRPEAWREIFRRTHDHALKEHIKFACGGVEHCDQAVGGLSRDEVEAVRSLYRAAFPDDEIRDLAA